MCLFFVQNDEMKVYLLRLKNQQSNEKPTTNKQATTTKPVNFLSCSSVCIIMKTRNGDKLDDESFWRGTDSVPCGAYSAAQCKTVVTEDCRLSCHFTLKAESYQHEFVCNKINRSHNFFIFIFYVCGLQGFTARQWRQHCKSSPLPTPSHLKPRPHNHPLTPIRINSSDLRQQSPYSQWMMSWCCVLRCHLTY